MVIATVVAALGVAVAAAPLAGAGPRSPAKTVPTVPVSSNAPVAPAVPTMPVPSNAPVSPAVPTTGPTVPTVPAVSAVVAGSTPPPPGAEQAAAALRALDPGNIAAIEAVDDVRYTDGGLAAATAALRAGATGGELWAATWVYVTTGSDITLLAPSIAADDPSTRAMAAAFLVTRGDRSVFAALIDLLTIPNWLTASEPAITVGEYAAGILEGVTGAGLGPPPGAPVDVVAAAQAAWAAWLAQAGATLTFDPATGRWVSS